MNNNNKSTAETPVETKPEPAPKEPDTHQEFICANEYKERGARLLSLLLDLADMCDMENRDVAVHLFEAGYIVSGLEEPGGCACDLLEEAKQLAIDWFGPMG